MSHSIVELKNVSFNLKSGQSVLQNINLNLLNHQSLTIIGHNGAGKSSLLKLLVAAQFSSLGEVHVCGKKLSEETGQKTIQNVRSQVSFIHQGLHLVGRKTALENVLMGRLPHNQSVKTWFNIFTPEDHELAYQAMREVNMQDKAFLRADKLSGGERQKIAIARALAQTAKLVLADEPTAALDPRATSEVAELLMGLVEEKKISLITVVHSMELLNKISERLVILKSGQIVFDGNRQEMSQDELKTFY